MTGSRVGLGVGVELMDWTIGGSCSVTRDGDPDCMVLEDFADVCEDAEDLLDVEDLLEDDDEGLVDDDDFVDEVDWHCNCNHRIDHQHSGTRSTDMSMALAASKAYLVGVLWICELPVFEDDNLFFLFLPPEDVCNVMEDASRLGTYTRPRWWAE